MVRGTDARAHRESKLRRVLHRVTASNEALADEICSVLVLMLGLRRLPRLNCVLAHPSKAASRC